MRKKLRERDADKSQNGVNYRGLVAEAGLQDNLASSLCLRRMSPTYS